MRGDLSEIIPRKSLADAAERRAGDDRAERVARDREVARAGEPLVVVVLKSDRRAAVDALARELKIVVENARHISRNAARQDGATLARRISFLESRRASRRA